MFKVNALLQKLTETRNQPVVIAFIATLWDMQGENWALSCAPY